MIHSALSERGFFVKSCRALAHLPNGSSVNRTTTAWLVLSYSWQSTKFYVESNPSISLLLGYLWQGTSLKRHEMSERRVHYIIASDDCGSHSSHDKRLMYCFLNIMLLLCHSWAYFISGQRSLAINSTVMNLVHTWFENLWEVLSFSPSCNHVLLISRGFATDEKTLNKPAITILLLASASDYWKMNSPSLSSA